MRILVTGGLGFIGSHLTEALTKAGHSIVILDDLSTGKRENASEGAEVIIKDASIPGVFDDIIPRVDAVFHLAAIASVEMSNREWLRTHQINLTATVNLFDTIARLKRPIPVVFASSAAVYDGNYDKPLAEDGPLSPGSAYGADKLGCEWHGKVAANIHNIPNVGLRFFNVYGPKQDPNSPYWGVVSIFAGRMSRGQPLIINGDGKQSRDYIYVADIVRGLQLSLQLLQEEKVKHGIFNLCTGHATTVIEIADALANASGRNPEVQHGPPRAGDARFCLGNPALAEKTLGFKAKVKLEEGLRHTLEWLKTQI